MEIENTNDIVVEREGRILLVKRANRTFHGWWFMPGGHAEEGETQAQAAQREANEEIGEVKVEKKPFMVFVHDWPADSHIPKPHQHKCHVFRAKITGDLRAGDDASELRWVTLEEAKKIKITEYTRRVLDKLSEEKEYFDLVDEKDRIIGKASREECHSGSRLLHRAIGIIIINSKGEFLFQKRSMGKDMDPGRWAVGVGGHVDSGESYERAAEREATEEIGITCKPRFTFKILVEMKAEREMANIYTCRHDGPFSFNKEEIEGLKFIPKAKAIEMMKSGRMTEFDMQIMRRFFRIKA